MTEKEIGLCAGVRTLVWWIMERPPKDLRWQDIEQISFERLTIRVKSGNKKRTYVFRTIKEMIAYYERWN